MVSGAQTTQDCPKGFVKAYENLESAFKNTYSYKATKQDLDYLKSSMENFLQDYAGVNCFFDNRRVAPTSEIVNFLSQLKNTPIKYVDKTIYGEDNRMEVDESPDKRYGRWANSVAAKIHIGRIAPDGSLEAKRFGEQFCDNTRFVNQLSVAQCTGFLIGEDILLTSGHCMTNHRDCTNFRWVFGFHKGVVRINPVNIYQCSEIISKNYTHIDSADNRDYAVIRLDRPVRLRYPLLFRGNNKKIEDDAELLIIGHPSGIPIKIADNGTILNNDAFHYFVSDLDAFSSNSGSPVINIRTGLVEGIFRSGENQDYEYHINRRGGKCSKARVCGVDECGGERVTRISSVQGIPDYLYPLSKREILHDLFSFSSKLQKPFHQIENPGVIPFYGYQKRAYILAGKRFLRICGLHIVRAKDSSWQSSFVGNCKSNSGQLDDIYKNFLKLIRAF